MILDEIKQIKSEKKDLRSFGLAVGIVLGVIAGLLWWKNKDSFTYFFTISIFLIVSGLIFPVILTPFQKAWMTLAVILGWFMTRVILIVLFYFIVTPLSLLSKLFGNDFLDRKFNKNSDGTSKSYWITQDQKTDKSRYEKQF